MADDLTFTINPEGESASFGLLSKSIEDIDRLLRELAGQRAAQVKGKKTRGAKRKRRLALLESCLSGVANRYAVLSAELRETKLQPRVAEQSVTAFKHENGELRTEVRDLKVELARRSASSIVTPIDLLRRDPP